MCKVINNFSDFVNGILSAKREKIAKINKRLNDGDLLYLYEKSRFVYRGQPNVNFELLPSIARGKSDPHEYGLLDEERSFIELCKFKRPDIFRKEMSSIELLALLQHYGMKTRLLDVTENPLVALYFACNENEQADGEVFIMDDNVYQVANYASMEMIASTYKILVPPCDTTLEEYYETAYKMGFELYTDDPQKGAKWIEEYCNRPFIIYAPIHTLRQQVQRGKYILFPNAIEHDKTSKKTVFKNTINPIKKNDKRIIDRFIIPSSVKAELKYNLEMFGISREALFCDNIDIICEEIVKERMRIC